jgi:hypothetical protein
MERSVSLTVHLQKLVENSNLERQFVMMDTQDMDVENAQLVTILRIADVFNVVPKYLFGYFLFFCSLQLLDFRSL